MQSDGNGRAFEAKAAGAESPLPPKNRIQNFHQHYDIILVEIFVNSLQEKTLGPF
jgi:hypothetical protein